MRVLAIGLGGAGSRIVDKLYDHDRRSRVCCMNAIAIDVDVNSLLQLQHLPESARIFFPPVDPERPDEITRVIDIGEVMTRIQRLDTMEIDAILLCCGLGGRVVDVAPLIVREIKKSYVEPIFALAALPRLAEGKSVSAKAADGVDILEEVADAVILFDNETWYNRIRAAAIADEKDRIGLRSLAERTAAVAPTNPRDMYDRLNDRIARQIGLLLRAGEFNEFGLEVAEVVLDAGEVLNTLNEKGFVAVGYAVERLPAGWLSAFNRWRSSKYFIQGSNERASRIVALAKKAVYEEVSVPCDLTSAEKALVLIAGPSTELSMKGFQTVRRWIDRSIAGIEMRSGDYPVKNTAYVGIIVMLAGLHNIPRLEEIRQIRAEYQLELEEERRMMERQKARAAIQAARERGAAGGAGPANDVAERGYAMEEQEYKDEMINFPGSGKADRRYRDETITMVPRASKECVDDAIILPAKPDRSSIDITGSAAVDTIPAPRNSVFDTKDIRIERVAEKERVEDAFTAGVKPVQRPKETSMTGERVPIDRPIQRARDGIFEGGEVRIGGRSRRPADDLLARSWRGLGRESGGRPKEVEPARGRLGVIDATDGSGKKREKTQKPADDEDDGGIIWIT